MTDFPAPETLTASNGTRLATHLWGPEDGVPVLLLHGWPELAYSWKHVAPVMAGAGYRVIAPNMKGYDGSDAPEAVDAYGIDAILADLTGLLDTLGVDKAVWCGHDWGGLIVWPAPLLVRDRVAGVIGINTPQIPPTDIEQVELLRQVYGDEHYIVRFQEPGIERGIEGRLEDFFKFAFAAPPDQPIESLPPAGVTHMVKNFARFDGNRPESQIVVPPEDRKVFEAAFARSGMTGPINYYRNMPANWARMKDIDHRINGLPCLMVATDRDWFLPPLLTEGMSDRIEDLELHILEAVGHWTMWEAPERLNPILTDWLDRKTG